MRKFTSLLVLCLFSIFLLASCKKDNTLSGYCVTFHLEGATYQQSEEIRYYYPTNASGSTLIFEPNDLISNETDKVNKPGYYLEGWYLSTDFKPNEKWNFETDKLTDAGLDLYANWKLETVYKFAVYAIIDGLAQDKPLGEYTVDAGESFSDYQHFVEDVDGYTFVEFRDKPGTDYTVIEEDNYVHPGGETDTTINIYAYFIKGEYTVVRTFDDLEDAINHKTNIYLYNDIDCDKETLSFGDFVDRDFIGNNHKIYNFTYDANLSKDVVDGIKYISLFNTISNSTISNVSFEEGSITYGNYAKVSEIHIYPWALHINGSTLTNINVSYSLSVYSNEAKEKTNEHANDSCIDFDSSSTIEVSIKK